MRKQYLILTLIVFSALALTALAPVNASASVAAQDTAVPTIGAPTVAVTVVGPTTVSTVLVPVTGPAETGVPFSTLLLVGLLVLIGFAIIVGGLAMSRTPHDDVPHHHDE